MVDTARGYNKTFQTGSMQRSNGGSKANWRNLEEIRNGYLGEIQKVWVDVGNPSAPAIFPISLPLIILIGISG